MRWHELRTDPEPFRYMFAGLKKADLRDLSDRDIQAGDIVVFNEFDREKQYYPGRSIKAKITHVQTGYMLPENCAMLSFQIIGRLKGNNHIKKTAS